MFTADLHLHSRFARATSKNINLTNLEKFAKIKGVNLLGTGDFQHPKWNKELKENLEQDENGILWSKNKFPFVLSTELSFMYSQDSKRRAIHHIVLVPNFEIGDQIIENLSKKGRLDYDGRPIFGMSSIEIVELLKEISEDIEIIPAHCMTPFFGIFGSKSGFDSLKECFKEKVNKIYAIETGMSADPLMLWRFKERINLVSFSDAHSHHPWRLGREATVFDCDLKYKDIIKGIRTGEGLKMTIETNPEYGKYHWDGHRNCNVSFNPEETKKLNEICPVCKKKLTIGVEYRVNELAVNKYGHKPSNTKDFVRLIPLHELISAAYGINLIESKQVSDVYDKLINKFGNEFDVLLKAGKEELIKIVHEKLADIIINVREGKIKIDPGYDGVYGRIKVDKIQKSLAEFNR